MLFSNFIFDQKKNLKLKFNVYIVLNKSIFVLLIQYIAYSKKTLERNFNSGSESNLDIYHYHILKSLFMQENR